MVFSFVLSNVGNRPAWITVDENRAEIVRGGANTVLPTLGKSGGGIYLMPGQKAPLTGQFADANGQVTVREVLSGAVRLRSTIRLSYSSESAFFGHREFKYRAVSEFRHYVVPAGFYMVEGRGD